MTFTQKQDSLAYTGVQHRGKTGNTCTTTTQDKSVHTLKHMNTQMAPCPGVGEKNKPDIGIDHRPR